MPTPSTSTGIPGLLVAVLLATILFLGFALAPRAFEFRAWPQPARQDVAQEVIARSAEQAKEVPVVRVGSRRRVDDGPLATRGRNRRKPRAAQQVAGVQAEGREAAAAAPGSPEGHAGGVPSAPVAVVETPDAPAEGPSPDSQKPAQLAEAPPAPPLPEQILRPHAEALAADAGRALDEDIEPLRARSLSAEDPAGESHEKCDERGHGRHGHSHGRRGRK